MATRLAGLVSLLFAGALLAAVLPMVGGRARTRTLRALFHALLRSVGVRLVHSGSERFDAGPGSGGVLMVANHLSWLDIVVLGAIQPMRMVAKREIRGWPVLGPLAARVGTLFVDRAGLRSLPALVADAARALRAGAVVGLFPEGTTWCGASAGEFRRAGFQAALDAGVPVRPVALRMCLVDGTPTSAGSFIGDDTLCASLLRVLRLPGLVVAVQVLPLLVPTQGMDRRELARRAQLAIDAANGLQTARASRRAARLSTAA
jgi:1-acyl-sn-glycerol-3-phosphate acyltransferase